MRAALCIISVFAALSCAALHMQAHAPHLVFCEEILSVRSDRAEVGRTAFDTPARVTAPDVVAVAVVTRAEAGLLLVADAVVLFISEENG